MKATVKGRYEAERSSAVATVTVPAGDVRLKFSLTDATVVKGPTLNGLALSLERPGAFIIDYNVPNQDVRFQFMNTISLLEKPLNLTYTHMRSANQTAVNGSLTFDPANKVSVNYAFGTNNCKVKYVYGHGELRRTVFEPSYDVSKNMWDFAVSRKFDQGDSLKAIYQSSSKNLGLEWNRESKINGSFKVLASVKLGQQPLIPKLVAESTWNFEM